MDKAERDKISKELEGLESAKAKYAGPAGTKFPFENEINKLKEKLAKIQEEKEKSEIKTAEKDLEETEEEGEEAEQKEAFHKRAFKGLKRFAKKSAFAGGAAAGAGAGIGFSAGKDAYKGAKEKIKNFKFNKVEKPGEVTTILLIAMFAHLVDTFVVRFQRGGGYTFFTITFYVLIAVFATANLDGNIANWRALIKNLFISLFAYYTPVAANELGKVIPQNYATGILVFAPVWVLYIVYFYPGQKDPFVEKFGKYYLIFWMFLFLFYYTSTSYAYFSRQQLVQSLDIMEPIIDVFKLAWDGAQNFYLGMQCSLQEASEGILFAVTDCAKFKQAEEEKKTVLSSTTTPNFGLEIEYPKKEEREVKKENTNFVIGVKEVINKGDRVGASVDCEIEGKEVDMITQPSGVVNIQTTNEIKQSSDYPKELLDRYDFKCLPAPGQEIKTGSKKLKTYVNLDDLKTKSTLNYLVVSSSTFSLIRGEGDNLNKIIANHFSNIKSVQNTPLTGPISEATDDLVIPIITLTDDKGNNLIVHGIDTSKKLKLKIRLRNQGDGKIEKLNNLKISFSEGLLSIKPNQGFINNEYSTARLNTDFVYSNKAKDEIINLGEYELIVNKDLQGAEANNPQKHKKITVELDYDYKFSRTLDITVRK